MVVEGSVTETKQKFRIGWKGWAGIAVWGLMIVYLFVAPLVEAKFFIEQGKPVTVGEAVAESSELIRYSLDKLSPVWVEGQEVYRLAGWSYLTTAQETSDYKVYLVLRKGGREQVYETTVSKRADVEKAFPDVEIDLLYAGFSAHVALETLRMGEHRIWIMHEDVESGERVYQETNKVIKRTPNTLLLSRIGGE